MNRTIHRDTNGQPRWVIETDTRGKLLTEQVDLDALEALYRDDKSRPVGTIGQADVLALISELRQERKRAEDLLTANKGLVDAVYDTQADRDRLHKAITEALESTIQRALSSPDRVMDDARRILRAALDKEGNDDGRV